MAKINTYEEFEREVQHIGFLPYFGLDDKTLFSLEAMTDMPGMTMRRTIPGAGVFVRRKRERWPTARFS